MVSFSCGKVGHGAIQCPNLNEAFPFMLPGWRAEKVAGNYVMISPRAMAEAGGKRRLIRGMGSTTWISNGTRPQDPGGGDVQLAASRDVAVARPVLQPASVMVVMEELQRDVWTCLENDPSFWGRDAIGVSGTFHLVGAPADAVRHVAEVCAAFAGGGDVVVTPSAVFAVVIAADVTTDGMVTVGVAGLADAEMAFPANLAEVVAVDVAALADAVMVTVGVADSADAGRAFPADLAGVVAANVATLADAGMVNVGVADLADAGMAP